MSWKPPALALALLLAGGTVAARAEAPAAAAAAPSEGVIAPLPDAALPGAYCLAGATAAMAAAFAVGPTESLMILSGAMHLPTSTAVLFIPLMSILGGGACGLGAAAQPAVSWAIEQSDNIAAQAGPGESPAGGAPAGDGGKTPAVRPMTEAETQSAGCVAGALAGFGAALATSPAEVAMLSSGANTIVSSTPILALGLLGTIVASGCVVGTYGILPVQAFFSNFGSIGDNLYNGVSDFGSRALALLTGGGPAVKVADAAAAR